MAGEGTHARRAWISGVVVVALLIAGYATYRVAYGARGFLVSFVVGAFLWLVDGLRLVGQGLGGALETGVYWQGYVITVTAPAVQPVLGRTWGPNQQGYGHVRPAAAGTGASDYVGPGQTVATGTEPTATIVAFDLGTYIGF